MNKTRLEQKNFDGWNIRKKEIHHKGEQKIFNERDIWWCGFGINVGREQNGRGDNFERPIVIINKLSLDTFICAPLSTKKRLNKFQSKVTHKEINGFALIDQVRVLDSKRLLRKIGVINQTEFDELCTKLRKFI